MSEINEAKMMSPDYCAANTHVVEIRKFQILVAGKFLKFYTVCCIQSEVAQRALEEGDLQYTISILWQTPDLGTNII